jgi:DNA/RNA-binding domain of Phe-tRNA-synthetase-like protein
MFMSEMDGLLLTAGHDLDSISLPMTLSVASGDETYTLLRGDIQTAKVGDMLIADSKGVISSIIYGPDQRTQITPGTCNVVFTVYAPDGIEETTVDKHLHSLMESVQIIEPQARVELLKVFGSR